MQSKEAFELELTDAELIDKIEEIISMNQKAKTFYNQVGVCSRMLWRFLESQKDSLISPDETIPKTISLLATYLHVFEYKYAIKFLEDEKAPVISLEKDIKYMIESSDNKILKLILSKRKTSTGSRQNYLENWLLYELSLIIQRPMKRKPHTPITNWKVLIGLTSLFQQLVNLSIGSDRRISLVSKTTTKRNVSDKIANLLKSCEENSISPTLDLGIKIHPFF